MSHPSQVLFDLRRRVPSFVLIGQIPTESILAIAAIVLLWLLRFPAFAPLVMGEAVEAAYTFVVVVAQITLFAFAL